MYIFTKIHDDDEVKHYIYRLCILNMCSKIILKSRPITFMFHRPNFFRVVHSQHFFPGDQAVIIITFDNQFDFNVKELPVLHSTTFG